LISIIVGKIEISYAKAEKLLMLSDRCYTQEPLNKSWMKGKQPKITQIAHNNAYLHKKML
jgi:hypothetical protein